MQRKTDVFDVFKRFRSMLQQEFGRQMDTFKTDTGGEYNSEEFDLFLQKYGINHELSAPYSQWQRIDRAV